MKITTLYKWQVFTRTLQTSSLKPPFFQAAKQPGCRPGSISLCHGPRQMNQLHCAGQNLFHSNCSHGQMCSRLAFSTDPATGGQSHLQQMQCMWLALFEKKVSKNKEGKSQNIQQKLSKEATTGIFKTTSKPSWHALDFLICIKILFKCYYLCFLRMSHREWQLPRGCKLKDRSHCEIARTKRLSFCTPEAFLEGHLSEGELLIGQP